MIDIFEAIATHLEVNRLGRMGRDIFINEMPESCRKGTLLFSTGEGFIRHTEISKFYRGILFVTVRAKSLIEGRDLIYKLSDSLEFQGKQFENIHIFTSKPDSLPQSFGRNAGGYIEWIVPVEICFSR